MVELTIDSALMVHDEPFTKGIKSATHMNPLDESSHLGLNSDSNRVFLALRADSSDPHEVLDSEDDLGE
jgi:hypothetical protein